jgi:hypothetical protein
MLLLCNMVGSCTHAFAAEKVKIKVIKQTFRYYMN